MTFTDTTDVERVEYSADLLEVKGVKMSSKPSPWITGRDASELLTTAETATPRRAEGTGLYLRQDRSDQQSTTRELARDVQEPSASSAWGSGDWNGDAVTCRSASAGTVRLRSPTIETSYVGRREARVQLWGENRTDDVNSKAHGDAENAKDTADQAYLKDLLSAPLQTLGLFVGNVSHVNLKVLETPMRDTGTAARASS